ncbi:MAG: SUMF1/EgtB/PvdO family nonheme iron enzyme [Tahibacter sp.]
MKSSTDSLALLRDELRYARCRSDAMFAAVGEARMLERAIPDRHRFLFYRGHLEAFDKNLLRWHASIGHEHPLDRLFAFGIDPDGEALPSDNVEDWPVLGEVNAYAMHRRAEVDGLLADDPTIDEIAAQSGTMRSDLLNIAIEHRLMHVETLAYMLAQASAGIVIPGATSATNPGQSLMLPIPPGKVTLGADSSNSNFLWDNEMERHEVELPGFEISQSMVSNADYIDFIDAGGYRREEFWSAEDWRWRCVESIEYPRSWRRQDENWYVCTIAGVLPLRADWPAYVSHAEASAYARWRGLALPTEPQWQRAAYAGREEHGSAYPWGDAAPDSRYGNFDFGSRQPQSVQSSPDGDSVFGIRGMLGNGWEWTKTIFAPFQGFRPSPHYPGYSSDFFDGAHYVLKGGSPFTAQRFLRRSFRNWYRPHYPYVFSGFRCVRNLHD